MRTIVFFDARPVRKAVDRATRAVLSKAGAFVRRSARQLIRRRKRPARPGQPPSSRKGHLRRLIFFGYEPQQRTVVIGPALLSGRSPYGPQTVPEVLEDGGTVTTRDPSRDGERVRRNYRGNPFMGPAMEQELPNFPDLWRDSVRR